MYKLDAETSNTLFRYPLDGEFLPRPIRGRRRASQCIYIESLTEQKQDFLDAADTFVLISDGAKLGPVDFN